MELQKNVAGQKWIVFAFDRTDNVPKAGDAANITANLRIDGGGADATDDTNPTELEDGYYVFDLTQAETNGDNIVILPASSTGDIQVIGCPMACWPSANITNQELLIQLLTGKWEVTGNQFIIYDTDGTTPLYTYDLTRDGIPTEFNPDKRDLV